jgi:teichuronic acid biosynthesis glycosyltransferase TuaC
MSRFTRTRLYNIVKILAISHLFPNLKEKRYGIFVARQLSEISRLGAEITVIVPRIWCPGLLRHFDRWKNYDHNCPLCRFEGIETISVPYLRLPGNFYNRWSGPVAFGAMKSKALELHKSKKFDVIYATDFFPDGDAAVRLAKYLKLPAACLGIGVDVNITAFSSKTIYRHFVRTAKALDGTLACGQSVAERIKAVTGKNPLCVYGVLDLDEFSPVPDKIPERKELNLPPDKTIALYAGYLTKRKGVYDLLEAIYRVQKKCPDILPVICGSGPEETAMSRLIHKKGMEHSVHMAGEIEPEQMKKWMQASDLFVLASHTEGMPNVVAEAMACGLPVVTTAVGGLPEAVGDCDGAILVPPENIEELEKAILKVISSNQLRRHMQTAARKKAEERFGGKHNARLILDYLQKIVEEHKG